MGPTDRRPRPRDPRSIRLAAAGDLHTTVEAASQYRPALVRAAAEADVLLLAGDLTHMGHVEQARSLAAELWDLGIKIVAVTGNHDHQQGREKAIAGVLTGAGVHMLEGASVVLSVRGIRVGIAGVKGFGGGFPGGLVHEFGEPEVKAFAAQARRSAESLATALTGLEADVRVCSPTTPRLPTRWPANHPCCSRSSAHICWVT